MKFAVFTFFKMSTVSGDMLIDIPVYLWDIPQATQILISTANAQLLTPNAEKSFVGMILQRAGHRPGFAP